MDYRELENRLAQSRALIQEREHDRLVKQARQAGHVQRGNWWNWLYAILPRRTHPGDDPQMRLWDQPLRRFDKP